MAKGNTPARRDRTDEPDITSTEDARAYGLGMLLGIQVSLDHEGEVDPFTRNAVNRAMAAHNSGDPDAGLRFAVQYCRRCSSQKPRSANARRAAQLARFLPENDSEGCSVAPIAATKEKARQRNGRVVADMRVKNAVAKFLDCSSDESIDEVYWAIRAQIRAERHPGE